MNTQTAVLFNNLMVLIYIITFIIMYFDSKKHGYNPFPWVFIVLLLPFIGLLIFFIKIIIRAAKN